ncbi:hypothetical protein PIB30_079050 [Stylosanthes scabra]|uniref:Uncharacterized protein n=1 Tax=Stylosanthes scabra TaxID=79078 RepID=A0ABU6QSE5_9FABA|nr:hypothetical protein [Stylosanthes scabra]
MPGRHCSICSCNSHYSDECPQLQEDNTVADSHNFYEAPPPKTNNIRHRLKGGVIANKTDGTPPNNSNQLNTTSTTYEEAFRRFQQENKEIREALKRTKAQLTNLTDLLTKFTHQVGVNPQPLTQPTNSSSLSSQPLPNPKGDISMVQKENDKEDKEEGEDDWLYELLSELAKSDESEGEVESEGEDEEESAEDEEESAEEEEVIDEDEDETFFIATVFGGNKAVKDEIPAKCVDP